MTTILDNIVKVRNNRIRKVVRIHSADWPKQAIPGNNSEYQPQQTNVSPIINHDAAEPQNQIQPEPLNSECINPNWIIESDIGSDSKINLQNDDIINKMFKYWEKELGYDKIGNEHCVSTIVDTSKSNFASIFQQLSTEDQEHLKQSYNINKHKPLGRLMNSSDHNILEDDLNEIFEHYTNIRLESTSSKSDVEFPVDRNNDLYPFGSKFWVDLGDRLLNQSISIQTADWLISNFHDKQIFLKQTDTQWYPTNATHLLCLFVYHNSWRDIYRIKCDDLQYNNQVSWKEQEYDCGYDSIANDVECLFKTECYRKALFQPVSKFKKLHKANPIHENNFNGIVHINETILGKYPTWCLSEKYSFIRKIICDETIPGFNILFVGNVIHNLFDDKYYIIYDICNDSWTANVSFQKDSNFYQFDENIKQICQNVANDLENHSNKTMKPKCLLKLIPLHKKFVNCHHKQCEENQSFFIKLTQTQTLMDLIENHELQDVWEILSVSINNTLFLKNANIPENEIKFHKLDYIIKFDSTNVPTTYEMCLSHNQDFFLRFVDPGSIISVGTFVENCNCVFMSYDINSDGFGAFKHNNGSLPFTSVKGHYWNPNHNICSSNTIFDIGLTQEHGKIQKFYEIFEQDMITLFFRGIKVQYKEENKTINKHVRLIPTKSIDDQGEQGPKTGTRGAANARNIIGTTETKREPIINDVPVRHFSNFVSHTVK